MKNAQDEPEIFKRVMRYAGKKRGQVSNPCITANETIVLANYVRAMSAATDHAISMEFDDSRRNFLNLWKHGKYATIREYWNDVPDDVFPAGELK